MPVVRMLWSHCEPIKQEVHMSDLFISLVAASLTLVLSFKEKIEEKSGSKLLATLFIAVFVVTTIQVWSNHTAKKAEGIVKDELDSLIRDSNSKIGALVLANEQDQLEKIVTEISLTTDLPEMEEFSKGSPQAWEAYKSWLFNDTANTTKALTLSAATGHNYNYRIILGYLWTNQETIDFYKSQRTFNTYNNWNGFPQISFLKKFGFPKPEVEYVLIYFKSKPIGYASSSAFAKDCFDKLAASSEGWMDFLVEDQSTQEDEVIQFFTSNFSSFIPLDFDIQDIFDLRVEIPAIASYSVEREKTEVLIYNKTEQSISQLKLKDIIEVKK